ncbi:chemotaxis protein MotC [Rhizobium sp. RU35A]|uniref:chemotaxis protein MotC n=1 Tax=Rhizobium sp. RU35A TaxID=1907414 RepID=UPI000955E413|nr:chemotaxis protein MotC [Rhizobium sp. RU35A]SIQ02355.1 chemotaxis protein MotC [Rhizobium sp. RU35A]
MRRKRTSTFLFAGALAALWGSAMAAEPQTADGLEPYQMMRSLQFVQDTVVMGDHSAAEMQRFMLSALDKRLRTINPAAFDDPRNVDAALIYAMSGGNPATLEFLVAKDVSGHFDTRVVDALRKYLNGKGMLASHSFAKMVPEYRNQRIGPYLALVAGNVAVAKSPKDAMGFYDWARLMAPGTIVEEAALRRSVAIAVEANLPDKALSYARQYARRFVFSPYASQFADLFVRLVVDHFGTIHEEDVDGTLEVMNDDRSREIYLRIARQATIAGKSDLARFAAARAAERGKDLPARDDSLARLFGGVAQLPGGKALDAAKILADIPDAVLSPEDRALRAAAQRVAEEVLRPPVAESFGQDDADTVKNDISGETVSAVSGDGKAGTAASASPSGKAGAPKLDPDFQTYVDRGHSTLNAIDDLLKEEK